jgi:hypothetical protein
VLKVVVTGSRTWRDRELMEAVISSFPAGTQFVHGAADGADRMVDAVVRQLGNFPVPVRYPVTNWKKHDDTCHCPSDARYCYNAAKRRNTLMLDEVRPDLVIAFKSLSSKTKGTNDTIKKAKDRSLPVEIYYGD